MGMNFDLVVTKKNYKIEQIKFCKSLLCSLNMLKFVEIDTNRVH